MIASLHDVETFITRWQGVTASELSTAQSFVIDLCRLLGVEPPHPTPEQDYLFERPITFHHGDGSRSPGRIDCYKRGHFVWEAKKLKPGGKTQGFDDALMRARAQAESYARALPAEEGRPPFLMVADVGNVIELYSEFSQSGATYVPFPDPRSYRIRLDDLRHADIRARLQAIWRDPLSLDPSRHSARVTREIAAHLAGIAQSLEAAGHASEVTAGFLTRCLFSMFAEDVGLIPKASFTRLLAECAATPAALPALLGGLWRDMDTGSPFSPVIRAALPRFNGKLFKTPEVLPLTKAHIVQLIEAAKADWTQVEPAIFGTLLERALNPRERHALGAHYTPRAYVERLVMPTVVEPLRRDWANAQAAALLLINDGKNKDAIAVIRAFHHRLCQVRVLDPACGSGNFLYVALEHLKRLEGEVLNQLHEFGHGQTMLEMEGISVDPHQFLGLEINPRAAAIAELVLWIGYLQWHFRTQGAGLPPEPVLKDFRNIECRDAVLTHKGIEFVTDEHGIPLTRWDGCTFKKHPVTGRDVPDESACVPMERYLTPRQAPWPQADFVVGNPPFIGAAAMRQALGDGYVEALRSTWAEVPDSADFVMFWWHRAAGLVRSGHLSQFGFITTNSIRQTFNRRVLERHLAEGGGGVPPSLAADSAQCLGRDTPAPLRLAFAIPDHPWVDSADGAAVRIAMTVGAPGNGESTLLTISHEGGTESDAVHVDFVERTGRIHADLTTGANITGAVVLLANSELASRGIQLFGAGFIVTPEEAVALEADAPIRDYRNGRDLADRPRGVKVIDCFGLSADEVRTRYPAVFQRLLERVKPERDHNNRATYRDNWWLFGEPRKVLRRALAGLPRYIATVETAKHRVFQFLDAAIAPDNKLICIALDDPWILGILSSRVHVVWALATGSHLGVGNDPVYVKSRCFETFPFPSARPERIGKLAQELDAHRKRELDEHDSLTLTGLYNVLEALKADRPLTAKEKRIHDQGLVGVLKSLHDELDAEVLAAYGWHDAPDDETLLERLVALNTDRVNEETQGLIRWLRPDFQNSKPTPAVVAGRRASRPTICDSHEEVGTPSSPSTFPSAQTSAQQAWPQTLPEQMAALTQALTPSPQTESELTAHFAGKGKWKTKLPELLATLATLGHARKLDDGRWVR